MRNITALVFVLLVVLSPANVNRAILHNFVADNLISINILPALALLGVVLLAVGLLLRRRV